MGIIKNHLSPRAHSKRKTKTASDHELLGVRINGFPVAVGIRKGAGPKAQLHSIQGDHRILTYKKATYFAVPIKGKVKSESVEVPQSEPNPAIKEFYPRQVKEDFQRLFSHPFKAILKNDQGQWFTCKYSLNKNRIWNYWKSPSTTIGLGFGKSTSWAALDLDADGRYHNSESLAGIREALEELAIVSSQLVQSSDSGGWHLFMFFDRPVKTFPLACLLTETLTSAGFSIEPGHLEVFPNRKQWKAEGSIYNRIRLPLQSGTGSLMLTNDGELDSTGWPDSLELFLKRAKAIARKNDTERIEELGEEAKKRFATARKAQDHGPFLPTRSSKWLKEINTVLEVGFTAHHQSNEILRAVAAKGRVFLGLGGEALASYIEQTVTELPGYGQWCRHQPEIAAWCIRWARSAEKKLYPFRGKPKVDKALTSAGPNNQTRAREAQERIARTVAQLTAENCWPEGAKARLKHIIKGAKCSAKTAYKYSQLWHPVCAPTALLPTCPGPRLPAPLHLCDRLTPAAPASPMCSLPHGSS